MYTILDTLYSYTSYLKKKKVILEDKGTEKKEVCCVSVGLEVYVNFGLE